MKATSLPSSTDSLLIDLQEKTILYCFKQKILYANSDSGLLFIMCGHCSPVVVWYNYHGTA